MKEKACKNCHLITKNETVCPKCKTHTLSDDYTGEVIIINPKESKFADYMKQKFGAIDGLVNGAGVLSPVGKTADVDLDSFVKTLHVNFLGTFYMCHYFIPLLNIHANRAKIVNFSGGGAAGPFPRYTAYAASKAAVMRFTENTAYEYKENHIDINAVAPGFVATGIHDATFAAGEKAAGKFFEYTKQKIAEGGVDPDIAGQLTVFLLSSASNGITGKMISAIWDPWRAAGFQEKLRVDKDFATLRRIDEMNFTKKCLWEKIITKLRSLVRGK